MHPNSPQARAELERLIELFPLYRLHKFEGDTAWPMDVRIMTLTLTRYIEHDGSPQALAQGLFPETELSAVCRWLEMETVSSHENAADLTPGHAQNTWLADWRLMATLCSFLVDFHNHFPHP